LKVALAQINTVVGDIRGNAERIAEAYRRAVAKGADLVLTPELSLPGYPPRDLLEQPDFMRALDKQLSQLAAQTEKAGLVIGTVLPNPGKDGKRLLNAAILAHGGKITVKRAKTLLPSYDVFDESRYFEPATDNKPFTFRGQRLGLTICEDAWNDEHFWPARRYQRDPVKDLVKAGAEVILNISASPYERGKVGFRRRMLETHAKSLRTPILYCALVGGNDELIFDGHSFALDAKGKLLIAGSGFSEDDLLVDPRAGGTHAEWPPRDEIADLHAALVLGLRDYMAKCGFKEALVGLSGGIDSAVVCALAVEALGKDKVTGVAMPSMHSSEHSVTDAQALANNLGVKLFHIPITDIYQSYEKSLEETFRGSEPGLAEQNLQARIRGSLLMALSNKSGGLLLSTGNKSEVSVGYCTLYGDMSGGLAVIADVPKTDVYALARHMNQDSELIPESTISKPPSAELAPEQKDQDDLPPYDVLDEIIAAYIEEGRGEAEIIKRGHKRELVRDILDRIDNNEYKRRQAAPALRVSKKAFGVGRRMPIARGRHREGKE
jgi:NAD+ synthase (glutamine-hydrolysing)